MRSSLERSSTLNSGVFEAAQPSCEDVQDLPLERAYYWERHRRHHIFLTQPVDGHGLNWTWARALHESRRMAAYLQSKNWPPGSRIVILSKNSAWWIMAELAIWMSGHVTVPIYTSLVVDSARQLFDHCEPVACFLGPLDNAKLLPANVAPGLLWIRFPNAPAASGVEWQTLVEKHNPIVGNPVRAADDLATIIYTSGTTGSPKGVMHRFGAFPYFARAVTQVTGVNPRHRVLSYLPLAHIAERALTETAAIASGWRIFFCQSTATFLADLKRARPTVFFSVPRLYAKFQDGVLQKISPNRLARLLRMPFIGYLLRRRILRQLGLGSVRFAASGSAPVSLDLLLWFRQLGLPLTEGYGTTETGITHSAPDGEGRPGYVGCSAPGVITRISPEGEVQVSSQMNMVGYYQDPSRSRETLTQDGFLRTGDLGELDRDGWLKIKGRIKEQFKTSKGKYVSPSTIELMLNEHSAVESSLVMGSGLPAPFAILLLTPETRQAATQSQAGRRELVFSLESLLASVNAKLAPHERVKFLVIDNAKWSIEAGFLTPTLKLKRAVLEAHYAPFIPQWAARGATLVWRAEES